MNDAKCKTVFDEREHLRRENERMRSQLEAAHGLCPDAARSIITAALAWDAANTALCDYLNAVSQPRDHMRSEGLRSRETLARIELQSAVREYRKATAPQEILKACDFQQEARQ